MTLQHVFTCFPPSMYVGAETEDGSPYQLDPYHGISDPVWFGILGHAYGYQAYAVFPSSLLDRHDVVFESMVLLKSARALQVEVDLGYKFSGVVLCL